MRKMVGTFGHLLPTSRLKGSILDNRARICTDSLPATRGEQMKVCPSCGSTTGGFKPTSPP
jgi:hypothetical protein